MWCIDSTNWSKKGLAVPVKIGGRRRTRTARKERQTDPVWHDKETDRLRNKHGGWSYIFISWWTSTTGNNGGGNINTNDNMNNDN